MAQLDVKAETGGMVWKIEARPGQKLARDETIMILESMKMEIPVPAPADGVVAEILVKEEEIVEEGQALARFEAS